MHYNRYWRHHISQDIKGPEPSQLPSHINSTYSTLITPRKRITDGTLILKNFKDENFFLCAGPEPAEHYSGGLTNMRMKIYPNFGKSNTGNMRCL